MIGNRVRLGDVGTIPVDAAVYRTRLSESLTENFIVFWGVVVERAKFSVGLLLQVSSAVLSHPLMSFALAHGPHIARPLALL